MSVTIVIPVFNEANIIKKNIEIVRQFMDSNFEDYEIVIVDDGSMDGTIDELIKTDVTIIALGNNYGKGAAIRTGILYSDSDYVFFTDADLPYPLDFITRGIKILNEYDIVCGKRFGDYPFHRRVASNAYNYLVRFFLGISIPDVQCGFKGFRKAAALNIFSRCFLDGFAIDTEAVFVAQKLEYSIFSLSVLLSHRAGSAVNMIFDSFAMFSDLIKIHGRYVDGDYNLEKIYYR